MAKNQYFDDVCANKKGNIKSYKDLENLTQNLITFEYELKESVKKNVKDAEAMEIWKVYFQSFGSATNSILKCVKELGETPNEQLFRTIAEQPPVSSSSKKRKRSGLKALKPVLASSSTSPPAEA
jgi:hypothetical protein